MLREGGSFSFGDEVTSSDYVSVDGPTPVRICAELNGLKDS